MPHAKRKELQVSKNMLSILRKIGIGNTAPGNWLAPVSRPPAVRRPVGPAPVVKEPDPPCARLIFALDMTKSREHAQKIAVPLTDAALAALPGQLEVAL